MVRVVKVKVLENYRLLLTFNNNISGYFDMSKKLEKGLFKNLRDYDIFSKVRVIDGALAWVMDDGYILDLCPNNTFRQLET